MGPPSQRTTGALCLLLCFVGLTLAGPLLTKTSRECRNSLPVGTTFVYQFNGVNKIENEDISQEVSISAEAVVSVPESCILGVTLRNVVSSHKKFAEALQQHAVEVYMDNGVLKGLKSHPQDPAWAVNVKRAVISMLQAPLDAREASAEVTENDILGQCETSYTAQPSSDDEQFARVTKTKKLLTCVGRFRTTNDIFFTPYSAPTTEIRTLPLASGTYICHQVLSKNNGVLRKAECQQKEKLYLSQQASSKPGVISVVTGESSIELIREEATAEPVHSIDFRKASLVFDHRYAGQHSAESLVLAVNRYCEAMRDDVRPDTGKLYHNIISSMRSASYDKILGVYRMLDSRPCDTGRLKSGFLQALGMAGTPDAVRMMAQFIENGEQREYEKRWLASLAYLTTPTAEMINAFVPVVQKADASDPKRILLPVSAMANTFCKVYGDDCEHVPAVHRLLTALVHKLQADCSGERANVVAALKALGNLGVVGEHAASILKCMKHDATDLRLYTLAAFRKVCQPQLTQQMLAIYADQAEDSEVRIAAYLNTIRCADFTTLSKIVQVYEHEKTRQVGSFVYSHLKSVHDSHCPLKAALKQLIASFPISSKFSNDPTMFSQHYEFSKFFDAANIGAEADASLVFSPKSFLPRSAVLNLTANVFSHSINLLEIGGRVEGLERILEQLMGPRSSGGGKIRTTDLSRSRRATAEDTDVEQFDNEVKIDDASEKMSFFVNVFGNEINFVEFNSVKDLGMQMMSSAMGVMRWHPANLLKEATMKGELDIAKDVVLADNRVTGATISGVGLVADVRAVSNVILKASAPAQSNNAVMKATLEPSAVIQIDASLTLDAGLFRHGARLATTIHTSSVVDVMVVKSDSEFKFRFNTPREKIELLNARSDVFVIHGDYETVVEPEKTRSLDGCTIQLPEIIGMKACITGTVPKPWYLAGRGFVKPFDVAITLDKTDKTMNGIEVSAKRTPESFALTFDTPGSTIDRKHELVVEKLTDDIGVSARWQCPHKAIELEAAIVRGKVDKELRLSAAIKEKHTAKIDNYAFRAMYLDASSVLLKAEHPQLVEPATLTIVKTGTAIDVKSNYPAEKPLHIQAAISETEAGDSLEATLSVKGLDATGKITVLAVRELFNAKLNTEYTLQNQEPVKMSYDLKITGLSTSDGYHFNGLSTWKSTCHPHYNNRLTFDVQAAGDNRKHKAQVWWGGEFLDESKTIRLNFDSKKKGNFGSGSTSIIQIFTQAFSPAFGLNWEAKYNGKLDLQRTPRITSELFVTSNQDTVVKFDFVFDRQEGKTATRVTLVAPQTQLSFNDNSEEISKGTYKGITDIEWGSEGKKLSIDYTGKLMNDGNHQLAFELRAPGMKPVQHRHLVRIARDVTLQTETMIDGKEYIVFDLKKEDNSLAFNFVGKKLRINYAREVKGKTVDVKLDLKSTVVYTRPIRVVIHKDSPGKRTHHLSVDFLWDAEANPDRKLSVVLNTDRENGIKTDVTFEVANLIHFSYKGDYAKDFIRGPNRAELALKGPKFETRQLVVAYSSALKGEASLTYSIGGKPMLEAKAGNDVSAERKYYYLIVSGVVNRKYTLTLEPNTITIVWDRNGRIFQLVAENHSVLKQGVVDYRINLKTPFEKFASQELTVKGTVAEGNVNLNVNFQSNSGRKYNFVVKGTMPAPRVGDLEILIETNDEKFGTGKAHLKYNLSSLNAYDIALVVETDNNKVLELDVKVTGTSFFNRQGELKFNSKWTPSYVVSVKRVGEADKFTSDLNVSKDGTEGYISSHSEFSNSGGKTVFLLRSHSALSGDVELDFEKTTLPGDNHRTYKLHVKRNGRELKADAETQRTDGYKLTSVNVCRTPLDSDCVSVTVKRNVVDFNLFRNNELNVKVHRKPDVTFEVDSRLFVPEDFQRTHLRLVGAINECKLGTEFRCDHTDTLSEQSLRGYVIERELLVTRFSEKTDKVVDIRYTAAFDAKSSERLELSYRREYNDHGYTSNAKLSHPKMRTPIVLKSTVSRGLEPNSLIRVESELEWFAPEDTVYLHYERRLNDLTPRNRSLHLHIHKKDKTDYNLHLTLYRSEDLQKPVFAGYYWSYMTAKKEERAGELKAYLGDDLTGYVEFASPYQDDFKITGQARVLNDEGDKVAEIVHLKNGVETKGKISYNLNKAFMKAVVLDAAGKEARELEIDGGRREKGRFKLVLSSFPEGKKTTDLGVEHTITSETSFQSRVYMPPEYLQRLAQRAKEMATASASKYPVEAIKEELKTRADAVAFKLRKIFEDMGEYLITKVTHIFVDVQSCLSHLINNTSVGQQLKKVLEANRDKILDIVDRLRAIIKKCCPKVDQIITERLEKYIPKRTRRSVEDEKTNLVMYVADRVKMFINWVDESIVMRALRNVYEKARNAVTSTKNAIYGQFERAKQAVLEIPDIKQIAETWSELYDSSTVGHVLPRDAIRKYIIQPHMDRWRARAPMFEIDRKGGRFVADVDMPVGASDLLQYWAYGVKPRAREEERLESTIDMIKNSLSRTFDARATVIDGKHFVTFDGRHISAAGQCSYLLARDFADGNFSVIMKAGDELSYVVQIDKHFIEINTVQETVTVNDRPIELPETLSGGITVRQRGDRIIVKDARTLQFTVYLSRNTATLDLRVWYFGRTAGLFGNYNREPSDDMMAPTGEQLAGEQAFLKRWETAQGCRSKTMLFREHTDDVEAVELCQNMFQSDDSPMAIGFPLRSADQYHDLCLRVAHVAARKVDAVCRVAHAYLLDVERFGDLPGFVGVRLPNECRK